MVQCGKSGGQVLLEEYSGGEGERGGKGEGLGGVGEGERAARGPLRATWEGLVGWLVGFRLYGSYFIMSIGRNRRMKMSKQ